MVYVQQVEKEKLRDIEEYRNKKAKTGMTLGSRKVVRVDHDLEIKGHAPSSSSAHSPRNRGENNVKNS